MLTEVVFSYQVLSIYVLGACYFLAMQAPLQGASGSYLESVILSLNHAMMDCSMY